jgi:hypothetical protein
MEDDLQIKMTFNGRQPSNKDDLQWKMTSNIKKIYLSNHWSDLKMEDDLK